MIKLTIFCRSNLIEMNVSNKNIKTVPKKRIIKTNILTFRLKFRKEKAKRLFIKAGTY